MISEQALLTLTVLLARVAFTIILYTKLRSQNQVGSDYMLNITQILVQELSLKRVQVENTLALFAEGATIPFVARYRKEMTGSLDEIQLRTLAERYSYLTELEERKNSILEAIASQGKLTDELQTQIENCLLKTELEDLYLPYRPNALTAIAFNKS